MTQLNLDYQSNKAFSWLGVVLLAAVTAGVIAMGTHYQKISDQVASVKHRQSDNAQPSFTGDSERGSAELAQEVSNANSVLHQLSIPWGNLFQAVEAAGGGKVTLLALEPDAEKGQIKINGETKNYKALMNYLTQLQEQAVFGSVYLQSHQVQQDDADKPVRFSLLATWQNKL